MQMMKTMRKCQKMIYTILPMPKTPFLIQTSHRNQTRMCGVNNTTMLFPFPLLRQYCFVCSHPSTPLVTTRRTRRTHACQTHKSIREVLSRLDGHAFTCECKYDGERAQVHLYQTTDENDNTKTCTKIGVFSRNLLDTSIKFPESVTYVQDCPSER